MMENGANRLRIKGEAILFGFPNTKAVLTIRPRPTSWRASGAALRMAGFIVLAAAVAIIPPHAPWIIGALAGGVILARRRWIERYTLESVNGTCPKCGAELNAKGSRLRKPHPVMCENCHHEISLTFDDGPLDL
jgi:hypothetical protein